MPRKAKRAYSRKQSKARKATDRFGGRATAGGVNYEHSIAAYLAVKMLIGSTAKIWEGIHGNDIGAITMQGNALIDDLVLDSKDGRPIYISAKKRGRAIALSEKNEAYKETVEDFVAQYLSTPDEDKTDLRLILASPSSAGRKLSVHLRDALDRHRADPSDTTFAKFLNGRSSDQKNALELFSGDAKKALRKQTGAYVNDVALRSFLRIVYIECYDFSDTRDSDRYKAEQEIKLHLALDPAKAEEIFEKLESHFAKANEHGDRSNPRSLRRKFSSYLKQAPDYESDIQALKALTARNLRRIAEHSYLPIGNCGKTQISRTAVLSSLLNSVRAGVHRLLTGEPGSGKSGLIHNLVEELQKESTPVVLILAEDGMDSMGNHYCGIPKLEHPLEDILANWTDVEPGVLITDAIDAIRDGAQQKVLRQMLENIRAANTGWTILASIREFDLRHSRDLRLLFKGSAVEGYFLKDITDVALFHVPSLSDSELSDLKNKEARLKNVIEAAQKGKVDNNLYRSPFMLRLASELLADGASPKTISEWDSPSLVLGKFWERRVCIANDGDSFRSTIAKISRAMMEAHRTSLSLSEISLGDVDYARITELRSRNVLQPTIIKNGIEFGSETIRFSHHIYHDYAIARTVIPTDPAGIVRFTNSRPLTPIFYRQSFLHTLSYIWESPEYGPLSYWSVALKMEADANLHATSRFLAASFAANRVQTIEDLKPLLEALQKERDGDGPAHKAIRHLISGFQDATDDSIRIGLQAWSHAAEQLSELLPVDDKVEGALARLLDRVKEFTDELNAVSRASLNTAVRNLLSFHTSKTVEAGWPYSARQAIEIICRTFQADEKKSEDSLLELLAEKRLRHFPHYDLFDLAHAIEHLNGSGNRVVHTLFKAAFERAPEAGQWEQFGTHVLPMRMQSSDQWNSIRFSLTQFYKKLSDGHPKRLANLACIAWNSALRKDESELPLLGKFRIRGKRVCFSEDFGHIWGRGFDKNEGDILSHFENLLRKWLENDEVHKIDQALDGVIENNQSSVMWSIVMNLGAEYPKILGCHLKEFIESKILLIHPDFCKATRNLLASLHQHGNNQEREALEVEILNLGKASKTNKLKPYSPKRDIVGRAQALAVNCLNKTDIISDELVKLHDGRPVDNSERDMSFSKRGRPIDPIETEEDRLRRDGIDFDDPINAELYSCWKKIDELLPKDGSIFEVKSVESKWLSIRKSIAQYKQHRKTHKQMSNKLIYTLSNLAKETVYTATWPANSKRWDVIEAILQIAVNNPEPRVRKEKVEDEDDLAIYHEPCPKLDAARSYSQLLAKKGGVSKTNISDVRKLLRSPSTVIRSATAKRLAHLHMVDPKLMENLIGQLLKKENDFTVLRDLSYTLEHLSYHESEHALSGLTMIADKARKSAPSKSRIHKILVGIFLFRYLRTGCPISQQQLNQYIVQCEIPHVGKALLEQLHPCRDGGWLTRDQASISSSELMAKTDRTWEFFKSLLVTATGKLASQREKWDSLNAEGAEIGQELTESMQSTHQIIDGICQQFYFGSGAYNLKDSNKEQTDPGTRQRFWEDAKDLLDNISQEIHPHTANELVETIDFLIPCAPTKAFCIAANSIRSSSTVGFQNDRLVVDNVVSLIEHTLADYPEIFTSPDGSTNECLEELLYILDLFVEAGWPKPRKLIHRLEEIYR